MSRDRGSDIEGVLVALRRRWRLVALCSLLAAGSAFAVSELRAPTYEATAKLLFRDPGFDQRIFGAPVIDTGEDPDRAASTNVELVSLDVVAERTADSLTGQELDAEKVSDRVEVAAEGQSSVVAITATAHDAEAAAELANTFAETYIAFRREADRAKIADARKIVQQELDKLGGHEGNVRERRLLQEQLSDLRTLEALQTGNAELVQPAIVPDEPASPRVALNALGGLALGLLAGLGLALLSERLDRRLQEIGDVEAVNTGPVLTAVPISEALGHDPQGGELPAPVRQAFWMLVARLRYLNVDRTLQTVVVTSHGENEGKTTIASHLALAAAEMGNKVLLLEADLHSGDIAPRFSMQPNPGLSEVLTQQASIDEAIRRGPQLDGRSQVVDILPAGSFPPNPLALIESAEMRRLLEELKGRYELIVIDAPPLMAVPDAIPLVRSADGVLVVARLGQTTRDALANLCNQLDDFDVQALGVVVNAVKARQHQYGYYGYGRPEQAGDEGPTRTRLDATRRA